MFVVRLFLHSLVPSFNNYAVALPLEKTDAALSSQSLSSSGEADSKKMPQTDVSSRLVRDTLRGNHRVAGALRASDLVWGGVAAWWKEARVGTEVGVSQADGKPTGNGV